MKKLCNSLGKKSRSQIVFLFLLFAGHNLVAQDDQEVIKSFEKIPELVQEHIVSELSSSREVDSLKTRFVDSLSRGLRYIYSYNLIREGNQVSGTYSKKLECDYCLLERNFWSYALDLRFVYCCKDPDHQPPEVELTDEKMKKTQKEKGCKKIGVCFRS